MTEWGTNSSHHPDQWKWYDANGRQLQEVEHQRLSDGWRWAMRYRLHQPWKPGETTGVVGVLPVRVRRRQSDRGWVMTHSERPLSPEAQGVNEVLCRRVLELPPGCHATHCDPQPDRRLDAGGLLTWSMVIRKGENLELSVTFARQG